MESMQFGGYCRHLECWQLESQCEQHKLTQEVIENQKPLANLASSMKLPEYERDYRRITDLFPKDRGEYFEAFFSSPESNTLSSDDFGNRKIYYVARDIPLYFSDSHKLENPESMCPENVGVPPVLEEIILRSLSRFAQELELEGGHIITCQISSYTPPSGATLGQGWHFDVGAKETMIAVLQNDFSTIIPNAGLDLSLNTVDDIFSPFELSQDEDTIPEQEHLSLSYPQYGALFVHGRQGKVIHRMSALAERIFPKEHPCKRTIIQLFRRDENWCSDWKALVSSL